MVSTINPKLLLNTENLNADQIICFKCNFIPINPMVCNYCLKLQCSNCIQNEKCCDCKKLNYPDYYIKELLINLKFKCKYSKCNEIISIFNYNIHMKLCQNREIVCDKCNNTYSFNQYHFHMANCNSIYEFKIKNIEHINKYFESCAVMISKEPTINENFVLNELEKLKQNYTLNHKEKSDINNKNDKTVDKNSLNDKINKKDNEKNSMFKLEKYEKIDLSLYENMKNYDVNIKKEKEEKKDSNLEVSSSEYIKQIIKLSTEQINKEFSQKPNHKHSLHQSLNDLGIRNFRGLDMKNDKNEKFQSNRRNDYKKLGNNNFNFISDFNNLSSLEKELNSSITNTLLVHIIIVHYCY